MPFPFFLAYATAVLEQAGIDVFLYDAIAERASNEDFMVIVKQHEPDVIVIETSTPSIDVDLEWARKLREQHPYSKIVFCGTHAEMFSKSWLNLNPSIDHVIRGEYEVALYEMVCLMETSQEVPAIYDGKLVDIDMLPWPARHFLPMKNYGGDSVGNWMPLPFATMWASRGCPYSCSFCVWPQLMYGGTTYRTRNPIDVVDEVEHLVKEQGFKSIFFDDDTFNVRKGYVLCICQELKRRNLNIPFAIMARADCMDREMLIALKGAGLRALKYGVESGSQEILDRCGKQLNLEKVKKIVPLTMNMGIKVHLTFMFGLPGETQETVQQTIDLMLELKPDTLQIGVACPWPGTIFYNELIARGHLLPCKYEDYAHVGGAVIKTDALSKQEIEQAANKARLIWDGRKR